MYVGKQLTEENKTNQKYGIDQPASYNESLSIDNSVLTSIFFTNLMLNWTTRMTPYALNSNTMNVIFQKVF